MIGIVSKYARLGEGFSKQEQIQAAEHPGRRTNAARGYQSASAWVTGLIDLRKPVILCGFCSPKFDPKYSRYRRFFCLDSNGQNGYTTNGKCDDCKVDTRNTPGQGTMFIPEEPSSQICLEPGPARRSVRARVSTAGYSAYQFIKNSFGG